MSVRHFSLPAAIGLDDSYREEGSMKRQHSSSSLQSMVGRFFGGYSAGIVMNASRVNAMRCSINEHVNTVSKFLTSKESLDKRF